MTTPPAGAPSLPDGYTLHRFDEIDGTNAEALRAGVPDRHVYFARRQTAGRGRQGREWVSPEGNLFTTICVIPPAGRNPAQLAFVAGLAVLDALSEVAPDVGFALKWPNDVLASGRKLSGILIEAGEQGYAVGIGVNLVASPPDSAVRFPATHLERVSGLSPVTGPDALLVALCRHFDVWFDRWVTDGFEPLHAVWLASAHGMGDTIAASTGTDRIEGRFKGLDADGALVLEDDGGDLRIITAGDVFFPGAD
ncbi:MAG: BirA family biotin operon repressor/biotin-[acetyl-CoA-carboxylase] ligase [Paracoccaceae bacterium]|jgi:BirA family biotin operon repressor/biotin-[acetyl-CoA-carboxylase] ligase